MEETAIPDHCPGCSRQLHSSYMMRPKPRWQPRAKMLFLVGALISGVLEIASPFAAGWLVSELGLAEGMLRKESGMVVFGVWIGLAVVAFAPAFVLGRRAFRCPKLLALSCRECGWAETYAITPR